MRKIDVLNHLAKGKNTFTFNEFVQEAKVSREVAWVLLHRLERRGNIEQIEKGKYLIIPLGAEKGKYTLNEFVIGSLLVEPYCIAYWSALHHYGLTEQIPNTVFIQTTAQKKNQQLDIFGVTYRFIRIKPEKMFGIRKEWFDATQVNITDREKTVIDCLDKPQYSGGIIEVAKAIKSKSLNFLKLAEYATQIGNSAVIRRLGYLSNLFNVPVNLPKISVRNYLLLDPTMPHQGKKQAQWKLIINLDPVRFQNLE